MSVSTEAKLLADIGGSYARFAIERANGVLSDAKALPCADYPDFLSALRVYIDLVGAHDIRHGAIAIASFLDCGLPSTVDATNLASVAKTIISRLNESSPDLIVIELGDGLLGGYAVDSIFEDEELRRATAGLVFCASDYVGAWGGIELLRRRGIEIDVIAGSVTDSQMGQDFIEKEFGVPAANARRNGAQLFRLISSKVEAACPQVGA